MADGDIAMDPVQVLRREHLIDEPHIFIITYIPVFTDRDAAAFLSTMLEGEKSVIDEGSDIFPVDVVSAEDAALLVEPIPYLFHTVVHFIIPVF